MICEGCRRRQWNRFALDLCKSVAKSFCEVENDKAAFHCQFYDFSLIVFQAHTVRDLFIALSFSFYFQRQGQRGGSIFSPCGAVDWFLHNNQSSLVWSVIVKLSFSTEKSSSYSRKKTKFLCALHLSEQRWEVSEELLELTMTEEIQDSRQFIQFCSHSLRHRLIFLFFSRLFLARS